MIEVVYVPGLACGVLDQESGIIALPADLTPAEQRDALVSLLSQRACLGRGGRVAHGSAG